MKKFTKKQIVGFVIDIVCVILCIILLYTAISFLANKYVSWFGKVRLGIESDSMSAPSTGPIDQYEISSFDIGDLIVVDVLNDEEIQQLQLGDVITYWGAVDATVDGQATKIEAMVTHRIVGEPIKNASGEIVAYPTRGDKQDTGFSPVDITVDDIIGKVVRVKEGGGGFSLWVGSSTGRFILTVVPALLIMVYVLILFIMALKGRNKEKQVENMEALRLQVEEELRAKIAAEAAQKAQEGKAEDSPSENQ